MVSCGNGGARGNYRQVGDVFDVHHTVITSLVKVSAVWHTSQTSCGGKERATSAAQDRFLVIQARRNHFSTASQLLTDLQNASGVNISTPTIRSRLDEGNLRSRRPCIRILLTPNHRRVRYEWPMDHVRWTLGDWRPVLFTDESRYCLDFTDRRARVGRRPGERLHADNIAEHDRYGGGSVMVCGGMCPSPCHIDSTTV